jgi:predicted alpha/beta superfamily hydrolase
MKNLVLILISLISLTLLGGCEDVTTDLIPDPEPDPEPDTELPVSEYPKTESTSIKSDFVYDNYIYPVKIYLPKSYETNINLPVIYVLDGKLSFDLVINEIQNSTDAIVVAFGDFAYEEQWLRRWEDLMPEGINCHNVNGKYQDFYDFITKELIPYIDNKYNNNNTSRTLFGHSSAGLFTLVSMFMEDTQNVTFNNFIAGDPELACNPAYFYEMLKDNDFPVVAKKFKFYLALSGDGDIDAVRQFSDAIKAKEYPWLTFKYEEFINESHLGVTDDLFRSALRFVF